jgi:hypothetical protein
MKFLKITKTARRVFLIAFVLAFILSSKVHAVESTTSANVAKFGITFPVAELGNCNNLDECKTYCNDATHQTECVEFAKKKGFYKEQKSAVKNSITIAAKQALGCDGETACKQFCSLSENKQKCSEFAKSHNLVPVKEDLKKSETLTKAKEILGCDSVDACKLLCQKEENKTKCVEFAKQAGLKSSEVKAGPGASKPPFSQGKPNANNASRSAVNKESICRENPEKCKEIKDAAQKRSEGGFFAKPPIGTPSGNFIPGVRGISAVRGLFDRVLDIFR